MTEPEITIQGWVTEVRSQSRGTLMFIKIWLGGSPNNIFQVVVSGTKDDLDALGITRYSVVQATGKIVASIGAKQDKEMQSVSSQVKLIGGVNPIDFPIKPQFQDDASLRQFLHLRDRTQRQRAIAQIRHLATIGIHTFFDNAGYLYIPAPMITKNDCEGAGEVFEVVAPGVPDFFGGTPTEPTKAYLTVSAQLHGEACATGLGRIYTFGPSFRAEKSLTNRHLAQFTHIEPEAAFMDLDGLVDMSIRFIQFVTKYVMNRGADALKLLDMQSPGLLKKLNNIEAKPKIIDYTTAVQLLQDSLHVFEEPVVWGKDLGSEHEKYLCETIFNSVTIVINYPREIKAKYMYQNPDGKTVACMDILAPGIGEVFGGSQRETRLELLKPEMDKLGPNGEYEWYLDLRRFGNVPHAGFGMGFERLLCWLTGTVNVRDVTEFPVAYQFLKA
jgi:asparaginyl-tRNA synthetase